MHASQQNRPYSSAIIQAHQLTDRIAIIGNASLAGASDMLLSEKQYAIGRTLAEDSVHINLGENPAFNENYMEQMLFPVEY